MIEPKPLVIWRFVDGKPGHEKQTEALIEGIENLRSTETHIIDARNLANIFSAIVFGSWKCMASYPIPDIAIGAGHRTHLALLAAKRVFHAKTVVIMNPSLPAFLFDAVITPKHDGFREGGRRLVTPLALAPSVASQPHSNHGIILVGGISSHFQWPENALYKNIATIVGQDHKILWQIADSRRTPQTTQVAIAQLCGSLPNADYIAFEQCPPNWLKEQLQFAAEIWITMDSASMLAESLNTKARVGVIGLPSSNRKKIGKIEKAATSLVADNKIGFINSESMQPAVGRTEPANYHIALAKRLLQRLFCD